MKKKVLAIVLSLTIAIAFMPTFTFAADDVTGDTSKSSAEIQQDIDDLQAQIDLLKAKIKELQGDLEAAQAAMEQANADIAQLEEDKAAAEAIEEAEREAQAKADRWQELKDLIAQKIAELNEMVLDYAKSADFSQYVGFFDVINQVEDVIDILANDDDAALEDLITGYAAQLDDLIKALDEKYGAVDWADAHSDAIIDALDELIDVIEKYEAGEITYEELIDYAKTAAEAIEAEYGEAIKEAIDEFIAEFDEWAEQAKEWAEEKGITPEMIEQLIEYGKELAELIDQYSEMAPDEIIADLIDKAKTAFEENQEAIMEAAIEFYDNAMAWLESDAAAPFLEALGVTPEQIEAAIFDAAAYAASVATGGPGYTETVIENISLQLENSLLAGENASLLEDLAAAQAEIDKAGAANDKTKKNLNALKKKLNNAAKVKKSKVVNKKPMKKGKKVFAKWKKFKKATINGYQVKFKIGKKKWKTKNVKNKKAVKKLVKKFKKGKKAIKVKVKVRAYYNLKAANFKQKVYTKWSKTKSIKVKKVK